MGDEQSAERPLVLVVDDHPGDRLAFETLLGEQYQVASASSLREALARAAQEPFPDAALLDVYLPDGTGLDLLTALRNLRPDLPAVMVSGRGDIALAVEATRRGAFDFLEKPPRSERLLVAIRNALAQRSLARDRDRLEEENRALRDGQGRPTKWIAESPTMRTLLEQVALVAPRRAPVLVLGESGAGKEEIARMLHRLGPTPDGPWVALSVLEVPADLVESALFGHEKGAFTGAITRHRGVFEQADGGTLFLDEIGETPLPLQKRLLRVLETGCFRRVGGEQEIPVHVRIITATHRDLGAEVAAGSFRLDLYHRLAVVPLRVPPLRERPEDLGPLAEYFVEQFCRRERLPGRTFAPAALDLLRAQPWPGNVRELRNAIERALILTRTEPIGEREIAAVLGGLTHPGRTIAWPLSSPGPEHGAANGIMDQGAPRARPEGTAGTPEPAARPAPSSWDEPGGFAASRDGGAGAAGAERYSLSVPRQATLEQARRALERRHLEEALDAANWNVTRAAERLGIDRTYCHRLIVEHGLKRPGTE